MVWQLVRIQNQLGYASSGYLTLSTHITFVAESYVSVTIHCLAAVVCKFFLFTTQFRKYKNILMYFVHQALGANYKTVGLLHFRPSAQTLHILVIHTLIYQHHKWNKMFPPVGVDSYEFSYEFQIIFLTF